MFVFETKNSFKGLNLLAANQEKSSGQAMAPNCKIERMCWSLEEFRSLLIKSVQRLNRMSFASRLALSTHSLKV